VDGLEKQVDEFLAQEQEEGPANRLQQPERKIDELTSLQDDAAFARLPKEKQDAVQDRLRELRAFQDFQRRLSAIFEPKQARNQGQLRGILSQLNELKIPEEYQTEWKRTETGQRYNDWREDAKALDRAVTEVRDKLQSLIQEGNNVLMNRNAPDLPGRARKVLDKAANLKLEVIRSTWLPGSMGPFDSKLKLHDIAEVDSAYKQWSKIRTTLESVAKTEKR
jgi:hypothetical protein